MVDGKPSGNIMILGFYDHDKEFEDEESKGDDPPLPRLRHHTQIYLNGSQCDLTGGLRHTEVRVSKIVGNLSTCYIVLKIN